MLLVISLGLSLSLALLRLGERLLPDLAGVIVVEIGEQEVEDFRVPADRVTIDALFDVLPDVSLFLEARK